MADTLARSAGQSFAEGGVSHRLATVATGKTLGALTRLQQSQGLTLGRSLFPRLDDLVQLLAIVWMPQRQPATHPLGQITEFALGSRHAVRTIEFVAGNLRGFVIPKPHFNRIQYRPRHNHAPSRSCADVHLGETSQTRDKMSRTGCGTRPFGHSSQPPSTQYSGVCWNCQANRRNHFNSTTGHHG